MAEHGTHTRYRQGCRCDPCREGQGLYYRTRRARLAGRPTPPPAYPLLRAYRAGESRKVLALLLERTDPAGDCLVWNRKLTTSGYPALNLDGRKTVAHRLVAECVYGPLNGQTVHHKCANRACIRPEHLEPVSLSGNLAEMHQRRWFERRIAELEAALAQESPGHPLLAGAGV